ncbi:hypothetical protein ScPMuIL_012611 [Solemya velum]
MYVSDNILMTPNLCYDLDQRSYIQRQEQCMDGQDWCLGLTATASYGRLRNKVFCFPVDQTVYRPLKINNDTTMSCTHGSATDHSSERQPLHKSQDETDAVADCAVNNDQDHVVVSLIERKPGESHKEPEAVSFSVDPVFQNTQENPYKETTITVPSDRRVPTSNLVPKPWKNFNQILIMTYVSIVFFIFTGAFANKYAWKAKMHHSKGLYGLAQRDIKYAVTCGYVSFTIGFLLFFVIIPVAVVCSSGC